MTEESNFPDFLQEYIDINIASLEKFHQTLKKIKDINDSDILMSIYREILEKTNSDLRIRNAVLGSFLIRGLKHLTYSNQINFIKSSIISQFEFFSNKHLSHLHQYLVNLIEYIESNSTLIINNKELSEFKSIKNQILKESQNIIRSVSYTHLTLPTILLV